MQYCFVASIDNLTISKPIGKGLEIIPELRLTNSTTVAKRIVNDFFQQMVGRLEANTILSGKPFVYRMAEYPFEDVGSESDLDIIDNHLAAIQMLFSVLWLKKDNALNFSLGFLQHPFYHPAPPMITARVSSNGRGVYYSKSDGIIDDTLYTDEEIKTAISFISSLFSPTLEETYAISGW